ncbi:MAG: methyltransferase domain-containing protein [Niastella sp.]|jgi:2-polyprenyl-3-methyl-5-hydroxy-6-metoxy-1,4-benzoquinol methylase|nr:methyltransferase domain-containing protein [Niastella sp.]
MQFTAHNILLNNGKKTLGDDHILFSDSAVWTSIKSTIDLFLPGSREERNKLRSVDLGCLEGAYTAELAKLGFDSLGIEAREDNIAKCNYVKENLNLPNLHFAQDDVRNVANYGKFDVTLCYGLLYHLNDPVDFLKRIGDNTNKLLLLNTHFAPERDIRYRLGFLNKYVIGPIQKRTHFLEYQKNYRLSALTKNEGFRGRWFKEWSPNQDRAKIEKSLWASYNNNRSFWLCKKDLTQALHDAGFNHVFEQFNYTGDIFPDNYTQHYNRTMFVALKQ